MAYKYPDESRPSEFGIDPVNYKTYEYPSDILQTLDANSEQSTPWIVTPRGVRDILLVCEVTGTITYKVEVSASRIDEIRDGTASGISLGDTSATAKFEIKPFSAIRIVRTAGTGSVKINYRASN